MRKLWFNNKTNNNLWFNQDGQDNFEETVEENVEEDFVVPDWEYGGETSVGDTIDEFSDTGNINISHDFDESGLPSDMQITQDVEHCEFIKTEIESAYTDMNYATSQEEIDRLYERVDMLESLRVEEMCN